jgi:hypothetical protein
VIVYYVDEFLNAVREALRMGALSTYEEVSTRPNFALARLGSDRVALLLVILGGILPVALFGYLLLVVGGITGQVAFGFDTSGVVDTLAPPGEPAGSWIYSSAFGCTGLAQIDP